MGDTAGPISAEDWKKIEEEQAASGDIKRLVDLAYALGQQNAEIDHLEQELDQGYVRIPTSAQEAKGMIAVATLWLQTNAPGELKDTPDQVTNMANQLRADLMQRKVPISVGAEWTPCVKLPVTEHVRAQRPDETYSFTRVGLMPIQPDDLIMRGAGEEYPIGRAIFESTYRLGKAE